MVRLEGSCPEVTLPTPAVACAVGFAGMSYNATMSPTSGVGRVRTAALAGKSFCCWELELNAECSKGFRARQAKKSSKRYLWSVVWQAVRFPILA